MDTEVRIYHLLIHLLNEELAGGKILDKTRHFTEDGKLSR